MGPKIGRFDVLSFLTVCILVSCLPAFGMSCKDVVFDRSEVLWQVLEQNKVNGDEVIDQLSKDEDLARLFGVSDNMPLGMSIREHTLMVFDVFQVQYFYFDNEFRFLAPLNVRLFETLKMIIALHDIGKPLAVLAGDKDRQHEFTVPILVAKMRESGFSETEINFAQAMVDNHVIGDLVRGKIDGRQAASELKDLAVRTGMTLDEYLPLQVLYYTSDAGSYLHLETLFSRTSSGMLFPKCSALRQLLNVEQP